MRLKVWFICTCTRFNLWHFMDKRYQYIKMIYITKFCRYFHGSQLQLFLLKIFYVVLKTTNIFLRGFLNSLLKKYHWMLFHKDVFITLETRKFYIIWNILIFFCQVLYCMVLYYDKNSQYWVQKQKFSE